MSVDGVVPFAVEVMGREGHVSKFGVGDLHAFRIPLGVVGGSDRESGLGAGRGDEWLFGFQRGAGIRRVIQGL